LALDLDPSTYAFQWAGITCVYHHTWLVDWVSLGNILPMMALNHDPPDLNLPTCWY
jgi:hypothetical protein